MIETHNSPTIKWQLFLFDGPLVVDTAGNVTRRFRSQRIAALLAYLAINLGKPCPREEIYDALWPEEDPAVTGNRLRVGLSSLRRQLEPPGTEFGAVIDVSERGRIRLRSEAVWCDVVEFEKLLRIGDKDAAAQLIYNKSLLPGFYDEWILDTRNRYDLLIDELPNVTNSAPEPARSKIPPNGQGVLQHPALFVPQTNRIHNLPLYLTRFFGRESEIHTLTDLLQSNRLVSIAGPGGIGKTRLATQLASNLIAQSVFVSLADAEPTDQISDFVLRALQFTSNSESATFDIVQTALEAHSIEYLILDNADSLTGTVADFCMRLLKINAKIRIIVTTRRRLGVAGEALLLLNPLDNPPHISSPQRLLEWPCVALFLDRARAVRPDFGFNEKNAPAVVEICQRLDGIPLAIELAAARTSIETPAQVAASLEANLIDLQSKNRNLSERHRSLRAAIQGSYDLLSDELKLFFASLSIFHDGWTCEAAESIIKCPATAEFLDELVSRSLILSISPANENGAMRFGFLQPLFRFAVDALAVENREIFVKRHAIYFLDLARRVDENDVRPYRALDGELSNVIAALESSSTHSSFVDDLPQEAYWSSLCGFMLFLWSRGEHRLSLRWFDLLILQLDNRLRSTLRESIYSVAAHLLPDLGRFEECHRIAEMMVKDAETDNSPHLLALALMLKSYTFNHESQYLKGMEFGTEALAIARKTGDRYVLLKSLSMAISATADYGFSLEPGSLEANRVVSVAEKLCEELMATMPPYSRHRSTTYSMQASILQYLGRTVEAYNNIKHAQELSLEDKKATTLMFAFLLEAGLGARAGDAVYSAVLLGAVLGMQQRMAYELAERESEVNSLANKLISTLGTDQYQSRINQGKQSSLDELVNNRLQPESLRRLELATVP